VSVLKRSRATFNKTAEREALDFASIFLADALRCDSVIMRKRQRVQTASTVPKGYVEKAVVGRVSEMMDQIPDLFPLKRSRRQEAIDVFAVVTRSAKSGD
jgi:hypothetical protein